MEGKESERWFYGGLILGIWVFGVETKVFFEFILVICALLVVPFEVPKKLFGKV